jgi:hypothetical protein
MSAASSVASMSEPHFRRDRRDHGGAPQRLDDDKLAEITEDERVEAGLDDYNPDEVPPATDPLPPGVPAPRQEVRQGTEYREEQAEVRREERAGELRDLSADNPFPPTRYEEDEGELRGIHSRTVVPAPGADRRAAWPPCAAAIACTMDSPSPLPVPSPLGWPPRGPR